MTTPTERLAYLEGQHRKLTDRAARLREQLGPVVLGKTDFLKRRAVADELEAVEAELAQLDAELAEARAVVEAEARAARQREAEIAGHRATLAQLRDLTFSALSHKTLRDLAMDYHRATQGLARLGEPTGDDVLISLEAVAAFIVGRLEAEQRAMTEALMRDRATPEEVAQSQRRWQLVYDLMNDGSGRNSAEAAALADVMLDEGLDLEQAIARLEGAEEDIEDEVHV